MTPYRFRLFGKTEHLKNIFRPLSPRPVLAGRPSPHVQKRVVINLICFSAHKWQSHVNNVLILVMTMLQYSSIIFTTSQLWIRNMLFKKNYTGKYWQSCSKQSPCLFLRRRSSPIVLYSLPVSDEKKGIFYEKSGSAGWWHERSGNIFAHFLAISSCVLRYLHISKH